MFSVIELYSASSTEVKGDNVYSPLISHVIYLSLGLGMVLVMQNLHYKYYRKMAWWVAGFSAALVVYSNSAGVVINGAVRAIAIAGFTIQPPEIAKLAVVLVLAKIMAKHQEKRGVDKTGIFLSCAVIAVFALLLFKTALPIRC